MTKINKLESGEVFSSRDKFIIVGDSVEIDNERFHNVGSIMKVNLALYSAGIDNGHAILTTGYNHPEDLPGPGVRRATSLEIAYLKKYLAQGNANGLAYKIKELERIGIDAQHLN
ncbi:MAG: hypothetical protein Q7S56_01290 [Nanoarchaeota archaeon]|nr:hypothetical protein [Nanoarchaeota archaeon]